MNSLAGRPSPIAVVSDENNVLHGDHYEIEGVVELKPYVRVRRGPNQGSVRPGPASRLHHGDPKRLFDPPRSGTALLLTSVAIPLRISDWRILDRTNWRS